jgi:transcriptional regulator GlxA family with amidase domain
MEKLVLTVREVAVRTGLSDRTVIRLFEKEPGVLIIERAEERFKRRYRTIRIPLRVFERVYRRLTCSTSRSPERQADPAAL